MTTITVSNFISASLRKVWNCYTQPKHIVKWNNASEDWHTPSAENDLKVDGTFKFRMESKDGKEGFDFSGKYTKVRELSMIQYVMDDGRKVTITFSERNGQTNIMIIFDPENINSLDMQKEGWQAILDNFKKYVESQNL
jgi:uncharacterized protein YndB with AHSA1/START domain